MNLSTKNIFARYYKWVYGELPNDLCSFFWGTVFAVVTGVFIIPGRLWTDRYDSTAEKFFMGIFAWFIYFVLTHAGVGALGKLGLRLDTFWGIYIVSPFVGALGVLGVLIIMAVVGRLGCFIYQVSIERFIYQASNVPNKSEKIGSAVQTTKDLWASIKGKYCTKINWKR